MYLSFIYTRIAYRMVFSTLPVDAQESVTLVY